MHRRTSAGVGEAMSKSSSPFTPLGERLSPWFPPNVKPVHRGWYDATVFAAPKFLPPRFYWNGEVWWNGNENRAVMHQKRFWRGLARKP